MRKRIYKLILLIMGVFVYTSCVDDYTDANPPHLLDAPTFRVSATGAQVLSTVPVNQFQNGYELLLTYDEPVEVTVSVIDAPGKIGDVTATASVPDFATTELDEASVNAAQGKTSGEFKFTIIPNSDIEDRVDLTFNVVITVSDMQKDEKGEASPLTTTMTIPVTLVACLTEGLAGDYIVTDASGNLDGGTAYTLDDIEADAGVSEIPVTITEVRPGRFTIDEVTGGVWPVYYSGRANPALDVDFCGTDINGHPGAVTAGAGPFRTFTIDGTDNGDGTITISWSYVRDDAPTPANPAMGTYTLTKVE
jgi:hypothetical protein